MTRNNNPPKYSVKQLLEAKQNYEAHLYEVNQKLIKMQMQGKSLDKQQKHIDHKAKLESSLRWINSQLEPYYEAQRNSPTLPINESQLPGQGKRNAGKALIVLGIMISVLGFLGGAGLGVSLFGFLINIIGIILLVSGNREQGRDTTVFGGGFISSG